MNHTLFAPQQEIEKKNSILVVDDEEVICRLLKALLRKAGHAVVTANTLHEAREALKHEVFDLVITDIYLGSANGLEILKKTKTLDEDIPVILLTANPDHQYIIDALRNDADDILIKPVTKDELYFRVERALEKLHLRRKEKRMKQLIQEREILFSTFMDHLPLHIFVNDGEDRILYANKKHDEYFGSRKRLPKKLDQIFPEEKARELSLQNAKARREGLLDYCQTVALKDGRRRRFRTLLFPLDLGSEEQLLAGIGIDETDQTLVREALKTSEARLAAFIQTVPHGMVENDTTGAITFCNKSYCDLLGLEPEDILGRNVTEFQPTYNEQQQRAELIEKLNDGRTIPESFTGRIRRADGEIRQVQIDWNYRWNEKKEVVGYIAAVTDVTRLYEAEDRIRRSEALLTSIMESPRNINIWSVDRDLRYTFFNYNHKHDMKYYWNADIKLGDYLLDYIPDKSYVERAKNYYQRILNGEHIDLTDRIPNPQGEGHVFDTFSSPIEDDNGNINGVTMFAIDATVRVKNETKIKQSLKDKEVLLREIHHRVKNNLQVISSILNMQIDGIEEPFARKKFIESQNRIRSMAIIHEQLYETANLSVIRMESYIQSLIGAITDSMISLDDQISISTSLEPLELDIDTAIPTGLILNELVSNSIKYARDSRGESIIRVELNNNSHNCHIIVRDNGCGVPDEICAGERPSLGLQLVDALAAQLGGSFTMKNDSGCTCTLSFPITPQA